MHVHGCAVLLCLVCLFDLACFFLSSFSSLILKKHVVYMLLNIFLLLQQKLEVDDLHLQLQNLKYEAMHLRREITNCLEFK